MDTDRKCWNSTLRPVSKKKQNSIYQPGEIVGNFTIVKYLNDHPGSGKGRFYSVICNHCKRQIRLPAYRIKTHKGCGCRQPELARISATKHGHYYHRLYGIWRDMLRRCEDSRRPRYASYGGRGIKVCEQWHDCDSFYKWAINHGYKQGLTLDRIDNDGDYCPENCRWVNIKMQATNTRRSLRTETGKSLSELVLLNDVKGLREYGLKIWARAVKKRANYKCELCGKPGGDNTLDAHHWYATRASNAPTDLWLSNGCCLCRDCHIKAHNHVKIYKDKIASLRPTAVSRLEVGRCQRQDIMKVRQAIKRILKELKTDAKLKELGI